MHLDLVILTGLWDSGMANYYESGGASAFRGGLYGMAAMSEALRKHMEFRQEDQRVREMMLKQEQDRSLRRWEAETAALQRAKQLQQGETRLAQDQAQLEHEKERAKEAARLKGEELELGKRRAATEEERAETDRMQAETDKMLAEAEAEYKRSLANWRRDQKEDDLRTERTKSLTALLRGYQNSFTTAFKEVMKGYQDVFAGDDPKAAIAAQATAEQMARESLEPQLKLHNMIFDDNLTMEELFEGIEDDGGEERTEQENVDEFGSIIEGSEAGDPKAEAKANELIGNLKAGQLTEEQEQMLRDTANAPGPNQQTAQELLVRYTEILDAQGVALGMDPTEEGVSSHRPFWYGGGAGRKIPEEEANPYSAYGFGVPY